MKKNYSFLFLSALILFYSCAVLTKSQVKNISAFAKTSNNYSAFPSEIIKKRSQLVLEEKLIGTIQLVSPDQIKKSIEHAEDNFNFQQALADTMDLSLQLIQQYSSLLDKLSSDDYSDRLGKNTDNLTDNLGSLVDIANTKFTNKIPAGVGAAITKAIFLVGDKLTRSKQAKALKEFIPVGDTLIKITVQNLVDALNSDLPAILAGDKVQFINTYTNVIFSDQARVDYNSLSHYMSTLHDYDNLELMRKQCISAARRLARAHAKLTENIRSKKDVKEIFSETQDLIVSVQGLFKIYTALTTKQTS